MKLLRRYRQIWRKMRKRQPLHYRLTLGCLLARVALTLWRLAVVGAALVLGAGLFAAWRPSQRAHVYYRRLALVALALTSFVDVMIAMGQG